MSYAELSAISEQLTPEVRAVLTVDGSVTSRNSRGGTAPEQVARQLDNVRTSAMTLRSRITRDQ